MSGPIRYEFCTLFDWRYLARGLLLYRSLEEHCRNFRLHVFCADAETYSALVALQLRHLVAIPLSELEAAYPDLSAVRHTRSPTEYYWTATPATCLFVLGREPHAELVVRLDADLMFYADPAALFSELGDGSVLLTPHRVAPEFRDATEEQRHVLGGRFNVQFEVFRNNELGVAALRWWHERCVEWCYHRWEPGRYGDQGYLDDWETRFPGVRSCSHPGAGLAPWNIGRHSLNFRNGQPEVDGQPLIFHHFQSLEIHPPTRAARALARASRAYRITGRAVPLIWTTGWRLSEVQLEQVWDPYVARLSAACNDLVKVLGSLPGDFGPLRARVVAFQMVRRRIPPPIRDRYWRARSAIWMRRKPGD